MPWTGIPPARFGPVAVPVLAGALALAAVAVIVRQAKSPSHASEADSRSVVLASRARGRTLLVLYYNPPQKQVLEFGVMAFCNAVSMPKQVGRNEGLPDDDDGLECCMQSNTSSASLVAPAFVCRRVAYC